jgi:hypothetical protein
MQEAVIGEQMMFLFSRHNNMEHPWTLFSAGKIHTYT